MQGLVIMVDRVEQTSLNPIFFSALFFLNVALCYHGEAQCSFYLWVQGISIKDLHQCVATVESISL